MGPSPGRHQVNSRVLGQSPPSYPSPAGPSPRGLCGLQGMVLCPGHTPSSSSSGLSQQDPRGFCLGPQPGQTGLPTAPPALLPRGTWPLQPSRESPVSTCQAGSASAGSWGSACSPFLLLDGDSSPGEDSSARRDHSPDWPASTTVCCPPGSPAGGCEALSGPFLPPEAVDLHFRALHNILLTMERRHRFGDSPSPHCPRCPTLVEDSLHFFTSCPRVAGAWDNILHRAILLSGLALTNRSLFYLAWSARPARMEAGLTLGVGDKGPPRPPPTSRLPSQNRPGCGWRPAPFSLLISFNPDPDFGSGLPKQ